MFAVTMTPSGSSLPSWVWTDRVWPSTLTRRRAASAAGTGSPARSFIVEMSETITTEGGSSGPGSSRSGATVLSSASTSS